MSNEYLKRTEESITSYWIRLYKNRQAYGLTFSECGQLMNEVTGQDWSEAKYRREMEGYLKVSKYLTEENPTGLSDDERNEIEEEKLELQKMKWKMQDARREFNGKLRKMSRLENLIEHLEKVTEQIEPINLPTETSKNKDKELLVALSDFHIGMVIDSKFNTFNKEVAIQRLGKLKQKTLEKVKKEDIDVIHIANLGDLIHGKIHVSARVSAEEDTIQQTITASEMLKDFIQTFLDLGIEVKYYNIIGNHSRLESNKSDIGGIEESFEVLFLTILDTAFSKYENYSSIGSKFGMIEVDIKNEKFLLAHGNLDSGNGIVNKLPQFLGYVPSVVLTGHLHRESIRDYGITTHITSGALCGSDDYATSLRLAGKPSQKILIITDDGIEENNTIYL